MKNYSVIRTIVAMTLIVSVNAPSFALLVRAEEVATPEVVETSADSAPIDVAEVVPEVVLDIAPELPPEIIPEAISEIAPVEEPVTTDNLGVAADTAAAAINSVVTEIVESATGVVEFQNVTLDTPYLSHDGEASLTFTKLPATPGKIEIKEIVLTDEEIEASGALSNIAYDITSDMPDGSFEYTLQLPMPSDYEGEDLVIKYAETRAEIDQAIAIEVPAAADNLVATEVDHFTIFFPASGSDSVPGPVVTAYSVPELAELAASDNNRLGPKSWGANLNPERYQEFSFGTAYPGTSNIVDATVQIELRRTVNVDDLRLEARDGSSFVFVANILPLIEDVDQTFNVSIPANYINTPAKLNSFLIRVRGAGTVTTPRRTNIDYLNLVVNTSDKPNLIAPADNIATSTASVPLDYTWSAVPYAVTYDFESCNVDPGTADCNGADIRSSANVATNSYSTGLNDPEALNFYWHTRAVFNDGSVSPWSLARKLSIDNTAPAITHTYTGTVGANTPWYTSNVAVDLICTDQGTVQTGIMTDVTTDVTLTEGANQSVTSDPNTCVDFAGNVAPSYTTPTISIDTTVPVITIAAGSPSGTLGTNSPWYWSDVTVNFDASDNLSGFDAISTLTAPAYSNKVTVGEGTALTLDSDPISDWAGNAATIVTAGPYMVDLADPVISYVSRSPLANINGWNNSPVTVDWTCADTFPVSLADTKVTTTEGAGLNLVGSCSDLSGRVVTRDSNLDTTINVDLTAPVITLLSHTPTPNTSGWNRANTTITWSCAETGSGIDPDPILTHLTDTYTVNGLYTSTGICTDLAGNSDTDTEAVKLDKTRPTLTVTGPLSDSFYKSPFNASGTASDALSGLDRVEIRFTNDAGGPTVYLVLATVTGINWDSLITSANLPDGYYRMRVRSFDVADNVRTITNRRIRVNNVAPVITILGANPLTHEALSTYSDPGATALDDIEGDITANIVTTNLVNQNILGTYTVTYDVSDKSGNTDSDVRTVNVVDTTKPVITMLGGNGELIAGESYSDPGATALDNYDGDITSRIVVTGGVNTLVAGTYTLTYSVTDLSGNAADSVSRSVLVKPQGNGPTSFGVGPSILVSGGGGGGGGSVLGAFVGPSGNGPIANDSNTPLWSKQSGFISTDLVTKLLAPYRTGQVLGASAQTGGGGSAKFFFLTNLRQGQKHADVTELQKRLIAEGFMAGTATGYFGPLTLKAVKAYQAKKGISPATGYVGALTRAELNK